MRVLDLNILKFSGRDCGTCHRMSAYDSHVVEELGCKFILVSNDDPPTWNKYWRIYNTTPQETRGFPTYLLVSDPDGEFSILGDIRGGMDKGKFRERLSTLLDKFR